MKRHICLLVCVLLMLVTLLVACGGNKEPGDQNPPAGNTHQHIYGDIWSMDETNHWHAATCKDGADCAAAKASLNAHSDADKNSVCDVCGYDYNHTHSYATEWSADENGHWHDAACDCEIAGKDLAAHKDADNDGACDVCEYDGGHEHTFVTDAWAMDSNNHWHAASCGHSVIEDEEAHDYDDMDRCYVCGYIKGGITVDKAVDMGEYYASLVNGGHVDFQYDTWTKYQVEIDYLLGANSSMISEKNLNYDEQMNYWYMLYKGAMFGIEEYADGSVGKAYEPASALVDGYAFSQVFGDDDDAEDTFYGVTALITGLYEKAKANPNADLTEFIVSYEGMPVYVFTFSQPIMYADTVETLYQVQVAFALGEDYTYKYAYVSSAKYNCEADENGTTYHTTNLVPNTVYSYYVEQTSGKRDLAFKYNPEAVFMTDYNLYQELGYEDIFDDEGFWIGSNPILSETPLGDTITFEAGKTFSMCFGDVLPETAVVALDNVDITYDGGTVSYWDGSIMLIGGTQGTYTLTIKTAQTTRTIAVEITAPAVTEIYPTVSENGIYADKSEHTVYIDDNGAANVIFSAGVNAYADSSFTATLADGVTGATLTDNGDGTYTLHTTEIGSFVITIASKENPEITATLTVTAMELPKFDVSDVLNGKYEVTFFGISVYEFTFNPIAADGTAGTLTVVDNNNTGWAGTYDYLYAGGELTYSNIDGVAAIPFYLDGDLGTFSWNNMPAFTVTHVEAEAPEVGGDLNGTYHVNFLMDGLYVLTFDNGTLTVEDNNTTQYTGTYTYTGSPATGMTVLNEDGTETDIFISVGLDGNPTFQCAGLMMAQPLVKVEGEQDGEDEPTEGPDGEYVVDFYGMILYTLTFDNGLLTIVDDNTGLRSGTYTYEINVDGGIDVYLDGELTMDIIIGVSFDGSYTFQCPELMIPQSLVPSSGGDIGGGDTSDQLVIGDNSVWVENAWMGTYMTFTAPATGNYTLAPAFGEYNAVVIIEDTYSSEMVEFPYTFYLWEGDVMTFLVMTDNFEPDTIDLVITQEGGSQGDEQPAGETLVLGENSIYVTVTDFFQDQTKVTFTAPYAGTFTASWADGETNGDLYDAFGNWVEVMPYTFTLAEGESIDFYVQSADCFIADDFIEVVIAEGEALPEKPGVELVLGENSVYVTVTNFFQDQTKVTFTAPYAGTFTASWADGETNGDLYDAFGNWVEVMPYIFTLEAGESINFYVQSVDWEITEDFIEVVIAEGEALPEEPGVELVLGENSVYVTVTNFFQDQTKVTFTAPFAGTFTISWADGETNGDLYDAYGNWFEVMPYTFTLEAGESINFYVQSADWEITEDYIELVIVGEDNQDEETEPAGLDGEYRVNFSGVTYYTLIFNNGVMMLTDDNSKQYSGTYTYQINENGGYIFFKDGVETTDVLVQSLPDGSYTFQCPSLKIPFAMVKYEKPSDDGAETVTELVLGESSILVTNGWKGVHTPFTAPESGIYILTPAEGEQNAVIIIEEGNVTELIYLSNSSYTFYMEAGQTKSFIIATHSHSADTISLVLSLQTPDDEPADPLLATFTFGENGEAAHKDGSDLGLEMTYKQGDYTLTLTGMSKVFGPAYDAMGNSCLKLGTSKVVGCFSFTVDEQVNSVVIRVAAYKKNPTIVNVNGVEYDIDLWSNNGEYVEITVDTTENKTVNFTTVEGGVRAMIDSISYYHN